MREEKGEKKTRTTIDVNKQIWAKVRQEAYVKGETISEVVERRLMESYTPHVLREGIMPPKKKEEKRES